MPEAFIGSARLRGLPDRIDNFLANLPLFKEMAPEEIERVAQGAQLLHVPRGEILFNKGDPCKGFHLVIYGQVKLASCSPRGAEKVVELIGPGLTFGEAPMFMEKLYMLYAQTLADSLLLHVSKAAVLEGIDRDPKFARKIIVGLSCRLRGLIRDVEAYSLHSGTQRVIAYLLREMWESEPGKQSLTVTFPAPKTIIASRLNLTPEHFSRILHDLGRARLITVHGRVVRITDVEKLREFEL